MKIIIVFTSPFPESDAGSNRIISYAREMIREGHTVIVHSLQPSVRPSTKKSVSSFDVKVEGTYEGIKYVHPAGTVFWPEKGKGLLKKQLIRIRSYFMSFIRLCKERKNIDIIHIYSHNTYAHYYYYIVTRILRLPYVAEFSEMPDIVKKSDYYNETLPRKLKKFLVRKSFSCFDGWILETQNLVDYYIPLANKKANYIIVPMTVEESRFVGLEKSSSEYGRYVGYCGNMREDDGISILIKAFAKIAQDYPDIRLLLAGNSRDVPAQKDLVRQLGLDNRIVFLGYLQRNQIPIFLTNAEVLCLASPTSIRASATMPCKVGEYLCTGNPVVVTGQGEIFKYLKDGQNAFLAEPNSVDAYAEKLNYVLAHPEEANSVGEKGIETAIKEFGSASQANRILKYYNSFCNK